LKDHQRRANAFFKLGCHGHGVFDMAVLEIHVNMCNFTAMSKLHDRGTQLADSKSDGPAIGG
jgi:hypothetical protein